MNKSTLIIAAVAGTIVGSAAGLFAYKKATKKTTGSQTQLAEIVRTMTTEYEMAVLALAAKNNIVAMSEYVRWAEKVQLDGTATCLKRQLGILATTIAHGGDLNPLQVNLIKVAVAEFAKRVENL